MVVFLHVYSSSSFLGDLAWNDYLLIEFLFQILTGFPVEFLTQ